MRLAGRGFCAALAAVFFLQILLLSHYASAASPPADLSDFAYGLDASINVPSSPLYESPTRINVSAHIRNHNEGRDYIVYLLSQKNGTWITERALGVVQRNASADFEFDFLAKYSGISKSKAQYAIVASGDSVPLGQYFYVEEDWSRYEEQQRQKLSGFAQFVIPAGAILISLIIIVLAKWAYDSKAKFSFKSEYTEESFFIPQLKGRPISEVIADVLINPLFWAFEIIMLAVALTTVWGSMQQAQDTNEIIVLTFLAGLLMPLVYFLLVWIYNNLVEKMPLRFLAGAFMWGIAAAVISLVINSAQAQFLLGGLGLDSAFVILLTTAIIAPIIEEVAKGLGLLAMWGHHEFSDSLHGLHLGLAVGLGFSFVENWLYFSSKTQPLELGIYAWLSIIVYRSFFNSMAHACFSAALGASLGWARSHGWAGLAALSFIPGVLTAIVLHSIFNITAILDGFEALSADFPVFKYNPTMVIALISIMVVLLVGATIERRYTRINRAAKK
ncbi:MAG: PrsW family intramembrane metalloprotease [Candidatus Micrarchaeota archaeon]